MDAMNSSEKWFVENALRVKRYLMAAEKLTNEFVAAADNVRRRDQAVSLRRLKARIMADVEHEQSRETSASLAFSERKLAGGVVGFTASLIAGAAAGHKDSLAVAADVADASFRKSAPFGTVLVAVGKNGVPDDVKVIPLSRFARESKISESQVRAALNKSGHFLTGSHAFAAAAGEIERRVLSGVASLPLSVEEFSRACLRAPLVVVTRAGKSHAEHPGAPPPSA
jgi:hypothetical protein